MASATLPVTDPRPSTSCFRGLLDPVKRTILLKLLAKGLSRRAAAGLVGCHTAAVGRTAQRDPEFALQLAEAEEALSLAGPAAHHRRRRRPAFWRAAAWILERTQPEQFARRTPDTITVEELGNVLSRVLDVVAAADISKPQLADIESRLQQLVTDVQEGLVDNEKPHLSTPPTEANGPSSSNPLASFTPATHQPAGHATAPPPSQPPAHNAPPERTDTIHSPQPMAHQPVTSSTPTAAACPTIPQRIAPPRLSKRERKRAGTSACRWAGRKAKPGSAGLPHSQPALSQSWADC